MINQDTDTPDRMDTVIARLSARAQRIDGKAVDAAKAELEPACAQARAALQGFAAFEAAHGDDLRAKLARVRDPVLERAPRSQELLQDVRRLGGDLLDVLTTCPASIRKSLDTVANLAPADVNGEFRPIVKLTDRLTSAAGSVQRLPDLLTHFEAAYARLVARLEREPILLPLSTSPTVPEAPPSAPRSAKSSLSRGGGV